MTQDEIIEMARQAGFEEHQAKFDTRIETFAKLIAEKERKRILDVIGDNQCECRCSEVVRGEE